MAPTEDRLARIEAKLDEVGQAIVALARVEERLMTIFRRMEQYEAAQKDVEARLKNIELNARVNGQTLRFAERLFWMTVPPSVTAALVHFWKG